MPRNRWRKPSGPGSSNRVETEISGPVPCFFGKIADRFRWQIVLRGPDPAALIELPLPDGWQADVDPVTLL